MANTTPWELRATSLSGNIRISIDNQLVVDGWNPSSSTVSGTYAPASVGWKPITIDYATNGSGSSAFGTSWRQGTGAFVRIPVTSTTPGYGLATSSTDPDGHVTVTSYFDAGAGLGPEDGLATSTTVDPGGLALVNSTIYEPLTSGYRREVSHQLPTGAASTVTTAYYGSTETADLSVCAGSSSVNQGGQTKSVRAADPSGSGTSCSGIGGSSL